MVPECELSSSPSLILSTTSPASFSTMADRPTTASGRPATAGRPMTSASAYNPFVRDQQYTVGADSIYTDGDGEYDDEDDESEDEDVFAFLPPSTADADAERQQQQQHQQPAPLAYPEPAFDPYARFPADSLLVGSSSHGFPSPADEEPPLKPSLPPPQSPPSTASHDTPGGDNDFHMRRIPQSVPQTATGTVSSREVHVSLPPTASEKASHLDRDLEAAGGTSKQRYASEISDASGFSTPVSGFVDDDDDLGPEGSIKCVAPLRDRPRN